MANKIKSIIVLLILVFSLGSCRKNENNLETKEMVVVSFQTNVAEIELDDLAGYFGEEIGEPQKPTREGFRFSHWEYQGKIFEFGVFPNKSITLTAVWEEPYKISFVVDEKNDVLEDFVLYAGEQIVDLPVLENKEEDGIKYKFNGWLYKGQDFFFDVMPEKNLTLTVSWIKALQISFDTGGHQTVEPKCFFKGEQIENLPKLDSLVTKNGEGLIFNGWLYDGHDNLFTEMPGFNFTLTASWLEASVIHFDVGDSNSFFEPLIAIEKEKITAPQQAPHLDNHLFSHWSYEGRPFIFERMPSNAITLKAEYLNLNEENNETLVMPKLFIQLEDDYLLAKVNRDDYIKASFTLFDPKGKHDLYAILGEFRGRGHGSWENFLKKGYKVKFDKKQGLFGLAANKHWALVAGGHDDSLIRHNLAYTIAGESLDYINFQTAVTELEVYINGSYHGVYSLFEQIRVAEGRVDIDSQFGEVETDYLLEYDAYAVDEGEEGLVYFRVPGLKYPFLIKGPKMTDYEEKGFSEAEIRPQVEYIKGYVTEVVEAIFNEDEAEFRRLADVNSFVDMYILHELFKNTDTGWSSFYLYKQVGDKLYAGPAWDFDLSSGVNRGDQGPTGFYVSDKVQQYSAFTASEIYISLMQQEWFKIEFANRFLEVKANITSSINDYYLKISDYEDAYKRDAVRWTNGNNLWETEQQNLKVWLLTRIDWLSDWCEDYLAN